MEKHGRVLGGEVAQSGFAFEKVNLARSVQDVFFFLLSLVLFRAPYDRLETPIAPLTPSVATCPSPGI